MNLRYLLDKILGSTSNVFFASTRVLEVLLKDHMVTILRPATQNIFLSKPGLDMQ